MSKGHVISCCPCGCNKFKLEEGGIYLRKEDGELYGQFDIYRCDFCTRLFGICISYK